jgi:hypothetical protein
MSKEKERVICAVGMAATRQYVSMVAWFAAVIGNRLKVY